MTDQDVPTARRRAVVAEDESLIRLDIVETLRDKGFDVVGEAGDGKSAVNLARELRPDLVIMDIRMPELDGIEAAGMLTSEDIAPVLLLSAYSEPELVQRAHDLVRSNADDPRRIAARRSDKNEPAERIDSEILWAAWQIHFRRDSLLKWIDDAQLF